MTSPAMQQDNLYHQLAFHCAPAMAGIKAANLISLNKRRICDWQAQLRRISLQLRNRGIHFYRLTECSRRVLLLVYHGGRLAVQLEQPEHRRFLGGYGYPEQPAELSALLECLRYRIHNCKGEYPHEIGVFLGYPLQDILGFIQHKGDLYKLCGYWKVYGDPAAAKRLFASYDRARRFYCHRLLSGQDLHTITLPLCTHPVAAQERPVEDRAC